MVDSLLRWRPEFPILETCTYLVSHSLGAMPRRTAAYLQEYADTWTRRGVRAWHEGWWEMGRATGDLLAPVLGVRRGTISMHQNVTVAMGIIASCFTFDGPRRRIVMTDHEFPSNMYLFEGFRRYGAEVVYVPSPDTVRTDLQRLLDAIDERTLLVPLSYVLFRSALHSGRACRHREGAPGWCARDPRRVSGRRRGPSRHRRHGGGLRRRWLRQVALRWSRRRLSLRSARSGAQTDAWFHRLGRTCRRLLRSKPGPRALAEPPERFQSGTPNIPALYAARAGYEIVGEIGVEAIRVGRLRLTRLLIERAQAAGFRLNTPLEDSQRAAPSSSMSPMARPFPRS